MGIFPFLHTRLYGLVNLTGLQLLSVKSEINKFIDMWLKNKATPSVQKHGKDQEGNPCSPRFQVEMEGGEQV